MSDQDALAHTILARHSTRSFLPRVVPIDIIEKCLSISQRSPSNSNTQPWRAIFLRGDELDGLKAALLDAASNGNPQNPLLPENFRHYRSELGHQLFGEEMGIPRDDLVARKAAVLRNYDFFGAPLVAIIYMDKMFSHVDSLSVGMWLQTFILELTAHGLDTCVEGSIAGFPHVIAKQVGIESNMEILCGLAVGYGNPDFRANHMVSGRDSWKEWIQIRT